MSNSTLEQSFFNSREASEISPGFVDSIHREIAPKIEANRVKEADFLSIPMYDKGKIRQDIAKVEKQEKWFSENDSPEQKTIKKCADVLEYTIFDLLEMDDWMGDFVDEPGESIGQDIIAAETWLASKYDDLFNGADIIFKSGGIAGTDRVSVFSIDTTFAHDKAALNKKNWDRRNIEQKNSLASLEYYKSDNFTGKVENVPRFIIGVNMLPVLELAKHLYTDKPTSLTPSEVSVLRTELGYKVVTQLLVEATAMSKVAENKLVEQTTNGESAPRKLSAVYGNLSNARGYFAQAHDKMSIKLKQNNSGKRYRLQHDDPVYNGILDYYNDINITKGKTLATNLGTRALSGSF